MNTNSERFWNIVPFWKLTTAKAYYNIQDVLKKVVNIVKYSPAIKQPTFYTKLLVKKQTFYHAVSLYPGNKANFYPPTKK